MLFAIGLIIIGFIGTIIIQKYKANKLQKQKKIYELAERIEAEEVRYTDQMDVDELLKGFH